MTEDNKSQTGPLDFNQQELEVLEYWKEQKMFEQSLEKTKDKAPFIFYDGPPFATGTPHYGHILGSTVKDTFGRYQTMQGHYVRRVWGWDCHGLPIENIVEQKLGISGKKQIEEIGVDKFNQACRENVLTYVADWGNMVERMARWVDFDHSYKTMDTTFMESVWWGLSQVWNKGLIYEDHKVLMYCSRCETPLSNFEVAMDNSYKDVTEESVFVKFQLNSGQRFLDYIVDDKTFVLAWTTTPWTLPGNTALNIGPEINYVLVEQDGNKYILARERLEVLHGDYEIKMDINPRALEGLSYVPLYSGVITNPNNTAFKIYIEDYVTTTDGTGVVHNAAMYGEVDYEAAKLRNLPREQMLDAKGEYTNVAPSSLQGKFFKDADKIVLQELADKGLIYKTLNFTHSYPHCWRCGTPLYYSALPAWFINIQKVKERMLALNEDINWYPGHLKQGRFAQGIQNAPDWNISRNRYWATPLPFWKCEGPACDNVVCVGSVEDLRNKATNFAEVYPDYNPEQLNKLDLHKPYIDQVKLRCEKCSSTMSRIPEVVDCWVESASMPFAELHAPFENQTLFEQRLPADFVAEYIPQTRAWFYVMHVLSTILFDKAPFKNVVTSGTILAEDGSKMSKSKNNFPDPKELISKYGVDPVRYYLLTSPVVNGEDLSFSESGVAEVNRKLSLILWNTYKFFRMYSSEKVPSNVPTSTHSLDVWMLSKLFSTHKNVTESLNQYNTVRSGRAISELVTELSTWYVRRNRDRIKQGDADAKLALSVLGFSLVEITKMLAPFMPYLSEVIYRDLTGETSVHLADWSEVREFRQSSLDEMDWVRSLVELGLSLRKEHDIKVRQPLAELQYSLGGEDQSLDKSLETILAEELNVKKVTNTEVINRANWVSKTENNLSVNLNTELTTELKNEGFARELERAIQDLRKKSGLKIGQLVDLYYTTPNKDLADILVNLVDRKKTFVVQIKTSLEVEADYEVQTKVNGEPIWLGVVLV
jgi:isoleucyl-tRNA synthetase